MSRLTFFVLCVYTKYALFVMKMLKNYKTPVFG